MERMRVHTSRFAHHKRESKTLVNRPIGTRPGQRVQWTLHRLLHPHILLRRRQGQRQDIIARLLSIPPINVRFSDGRKEKPNSCPGALWKRLCKQGVEKQSHSRHYVGEGTDARPPCLYHPNRRYLESVPAPKRGGRG